jgi:energy-coupling factor transporter ATP-binding protein EcfA2
VDGLLQGYAVSGLAPLIAIIGADGSGKSTLAADLAAAIAHDRLCQHVYLGLGSGPIGQRIAAWPLIGPLLGRFIGKKADRTRDPKDKIPGAFTALIVYWFSTRRKKRFDQMMALRERGVLVITDRYPQVEVPGFYDGPGLSAARAEGRFLRWLSAREAALYADMAAHVPTLVLRLTIDADTALARKPEHGRALVEQKIAITPRLTFGGAPIADIDATMDYAAEKALARRLIDQALIAG